MRRLLADPDARADLILAVGVWVLAGAAYGGAEALPPPLFDPLGSAAAPKLVSIVLAVLAAAIVVRRWLLLRAAPAAREDDGGEAPAPLRPDVAAASIAITLGYAGVMTFGLLGFREATVLFVILLGGAMSRFRRSTMLALVPLALVVAIGCAWLFSAVLYIDLPATEWLP
jgi:putative tricarboxylic transport membrane protein